MPLGLNRGSTPSARNGTPVNLPLTFGTPVNLAIKNFGNSVTLPINFGNSVTLPINFGNYPPFTYGNPTTSGPIVTSLSTSSGAYGGGTYVTITGTNFGMDSTVTFGGIAATSVVVVSSIQITCVTPAGTPNTTVDVIVTSNSQSGTLTNAFTYPASISVTFSNMVDNTDWAWIIGAFKAASSTPTFLASIEAITATYGGTNLTTGYPVYSGGAAFIDTTGASIIIATLRSKLGTPTISDSKSNIWSYGPAITTTGSTCVMRIAYCVNPIISATHTFTPASTSGTNESCDVFAFTGGTGWTLDTEAGSTTAASGTSVTIGTLSPATTNEIFVASLGSNQSESLGIANNGFSGGIAGQAADIALPQFIASQPEGGVAAYLIQ